MSAHEVSLVLKGKGLTKYHEDDVLCKILNKGFKYEWYYGINDCESSFLNDEEINICVTTKNSHFKKILKNVKKLMPEVTEIYYHVTPYWTNGPDRDIDEETGKVQRYYTDDEFEYWTNDKELKNKFYADQRWDAVSLDPTPWFMKDLFKEWVDEAGEPDTCEIASQIANAAYGKYIEHKGYENAPFWTSKYQGGSC